MFLKQVQELLESLTKLYPPEGRARHYICLNSKGELELDLFHDNLVFPLTFEEKDLELNVDDTIVEIVAAHGARHV